MTTVLATTEYIGYRDVKGDAVVRRVAGGRIKELPLRLDLDNHSPTGFEWGYGGSGPAQLALAILADALGDDRRAQRLHQQFKWTVVAGLDQGAGWRISTEAVMAAVQTIERLRNKPA